VLTDRTAATLRTTIAVCAIVSVMMVAGAAIDRNQLFYGHYLHLNVNVFTTTQPAQARAAVDRTTRAVAARAAADGYAIAFKPIGESPETRRDGTLTGRTIAHQLLWIGDSNFNRLMAEDKRFSSVTGPAEIAVDAPRPVVTLAEYAFGALFLLMVLSFGSTETRANDPFAAPRGMHPVVVGAQVLLLGVLGVATVGYLEHGTLVSAVIYATIVSLTLFSVARWLAISRQSWRTPFLRVAYRALVVVTLAFVPLEALAIGLTAHNL
jgi:hypothetical protein